MFIAIDRVFLTVYILEILVKWYHNFIGFWKVGWNVFDFSIVVASLLGPSKCISIVYLSYVECFVLSVWKTTTYL